MTHMQPLDPMIAALRRVARKIRARRDMLCHSHSARVAYGDCASMLTEELDRFEPPSRPDLPPLPEETVDLDGDFTKPHSEGAP